MNPRIFLGVLITFSLLACKGDAPDSKDIYFGGRIVNPTSKFVVLLKKNVVVDTFYLDQDNRFGGKLRAADRGLYVFKHPPENQILYLEPGDSTLVHLNTLDFDQSLTFSGTGAAKSNFLNKMYLLNLENNDFILSHYKLDPVAFGLKTDSIRDHRIIELEKLKNRNNFSDEFYNLATSTVNYEFYHLRERYAFLIRRYSRENISQIPADFHDYRKEISFNDEELEDSYVYLNFLDDYLRTRSVEYCEDNNIKDSQCFDMANFANIKRRIILTDSLIENARIKNNFLERLAAQGIVYSKNREDLIGIVQLLEETAYNGAKIDDLRQMAGIQNALFPGRNLGELKLLNVKRDTVLLKILSKKPTITYHWSVNSLKHRKWQHQIIDDLREKYPEIDFIGINIDNNQFTEWEKIITTEGFDPTQEFKLNVLNINNDLLKNYLNKLIFLDPSGNIIRGDTKLNTLDYESRILEFIGGENIL